MLKSKKAKTQKKLKNYHFTIDFWMHGRSGKIQVVVDDYSLRNARKQLDSCFGSSSRRMWTFDFSQEAI